MKYLILLFAAIQAMATVNEPLRIEFFSGYRNDRIHWHLKQPGEGGVLTYSEIYRNLQFWENGLALKVIHRDLTFFLKGSYSAFGRGELSQRYPEEPFQNWFPFSTTGWAADGSGYFGYAVNLTAGRIYKVLLTPLIGYGFSLEELRRGEGIKTIDSFSTKVPGVFRLLWNGFLFGAGVTIEPGNRLIFDVGYAYHLMHNRMKTTFAHTEGGLFTLESVKTSSGGNIGQTGWAQMDWCFSRQGRFGIGGQIQYYSTRVVDAAIRQNGIDPTSQKLKLRWTPISGWVQISRSF